MRRIYGLQWILAAIALTCFFGRSTLQSSSAQSLPWLVEAEKAQIRQGKVIIKRHPNASGGAFVAAESNATLNFSVNAPQPMLVRVVPVFWRNSLREQPRFFPYPLPTLFGPDVVAALGNRFYFTPPESGQFGVVYK